ncbi:hypothetical protein PR048_016155 [Dryococelus australis]|uniref:Uncharacterized protein n=1 Tax=Dryococelus australis TaxID=614101 RepID=A0ABQ9HIY7_9NEOP|nr:hypothetical protein PR048_016155 [Dryococelus australis]
MLHSLTRCTSDKLWLKIFLLFVVLTEKTCWHISMERLRHVQILINLHLWRYPHR